MTAGKRQRPTGLQLLGPGRKLRPVLVSEAQIVRAQREFFETDEV